MRRAGSAAQPAAARGSDEDDDGDDEWDAEDDKIRLLKAQKRQQDRAKVAALAARAAVSLMHAGAAHGRMAPQPPPEPPGSGFRRGSIGGSNGGAGPGPSSQSQAQRGLGTAVSLSAASPMAQFYRERALAEEAAGVHEPEQGGGPNRLQQLMALQRRRAEQEARQHEVDAALAHGGEGDGGPGSAPSVSFRPGAARNGPHATPTAEEPPRQPPHPHARPAPPQQLPGRPSQAGRSGQGGPEAPARPPSAQLRTSLSSPDPPAPQPQSQQQRLAAFAEPPTQALPRPLQAPAQEADSGAAAAHALARAVSGTDFDVDALLSSFEPGQADGGAAQSWGVRMPQPPPEPPAAPGVSTQRSVRATVSDVADMRVSAIGLGAGPDGIRGVASARPGAAMASGPSATGVTSAPPGPAGAATSRFSLLGSQLVAGNGGATAATAPGATEARQGEGGPGAAAAAAVAAAMSRGVGSPAASALAARPIYRVSGNGIGAPVPAAASSPVHGRPSPAASPVRPQRLAAKRSSDGTTSLALLSALSGSDLVAAGSATSGVGAGPGAAALASRRVGLLANSPRTSNPGSGGSGGGAGDPSPVPRAPNSGLGRPMDGSGSILLSLAAEPPGRSSTNGLSSGPAPGPASGSTVHTLSRFGAAMNQALHQDVVRASAPALLAVPSERSYDSDSALTRNGPARGSRTTGSSMAYMAGGSGGGAPLAGGVAGGAGGSPLLMGRSRFAVASSVAVA
jgi:hypothetical protein